MHIGDWHDDGEDAAYEEMCDAADAFNRGESYNPFGWIAYIISDHGDNSIYVTTEDDKFIARFANSPADELDKFMQRLEEGIE